MPFYEDDQPAGSIWVVFHTAERQFDMEDLRLMTSLSSFASAARRLTRSRDEDANVRSVLERHIEQRTKALSLANKTLQYQMLERERIDATLRETQDQLKAEVAALNRLQELSARLLTIPDLPSALAEICKQPRNCTRRTWVTSVCTIRTEKCFQLKFIKVLTRNSLTVLKQSTDAAIHLAHAPFAPGSG